MANADAPPPKRGWLSVLTGTRPGLEWFMLAALPAIIAGSVTGQLFGWWPGLAAGFGVLFVGILLARRVSRGRIEHRDGPE